MLRCGETKVANEKFYAAKKKKIFGILILIIVISKLIETKTSAKYLIGYLLDKVIRPLALILPKMS